MKRLPGGVLAVLAALGLLAQVLALARRAWELDRRDRDLVEFALSVLGPMIAVLTGRILLALLPAGEVGSHAPRAWSTTLGTSLVLGAIVGTACASSSGLLAGAVLGLLVLAGWIRFAARPEARVPRHLPPAGPHDRIEGLIVIALAIWCLAWFPTRDAATAWSLLALFACLAHGLRTARRARVGCFALLAFGVLHSSFGEFDHPSLLGLGFGAAFLIPWLRRADRRAGALSAIGFGSLFLAGPDPLPIGAALVFVRASAPRQRRFAFLSIAIVAALALARQSDPHYSRRRFTCIPEYPHLRLESLRDIALGWGGWGLAWPLLGAALLLGALTFSWKARPFVVGAIEEPRREALALVALLLVACGAFACRGWNTWTEGEALLLLFPLVSLLAGLLLIPPEVPHAPPQATLEPLD